jgi:hypothetical protein
VERCPVQRRAHRGPSEVDGPVFAVKEMTRARALGRRRSHKRLPTACVLLLRPEVMPRFGERWQVAA